MLSKFLLLILPLTCSAASIKLTKRQLSNSALEDRDARELSSVQLPTQGETGITSAHGSVSSGGQAVSTGRSSIIAHEFSATQMISTYGPNLMADESGSSASSGGGVVKSTNSPGPDSATTAGSSSASASRVSSTNNVSPPVFGSSSSKTVASSSVKGISSSVPPSDPTNQVASKQPQPKSTLSRPIATDVALAPVKPWVYTIDVKLGPEGKTVPLLVRSSYRHTLEPRS